MILIDAVSILWFISAVLWGIVLTQVLMLLFANWWRIERWLAAEWASIPIVADIRYRRQREEFNWWWANLTEEEIAVYRRSQSQMIEMTEALGAAVRQMGISADEATKALEVLAATRETWSQELRESLAEG